MADLPREFAELDALYIEYQSTDPENDDRLAKVLLYFADEALRRWPEIRVLLKGE